MNHYSISEFSRMSGLPVKTLRFYHEKQLLIPVYVDPDSGYRYFDHKNLETSRVIVALRKLDFGLDTIAEILEGRDDDSDLLEYLEQQKDQLQNEIRHRNDIVHTLNRILETETEARALMKQNGYAIEEKNLAPVLVGGTRMKGRYNECGKAFGRLGRKLGRHIGGKAMMLCYDEEYREEDADFEPCMPLKRKVAPEGVDVRELPGGDCIALLHSGPYDTISRSYARLVEYAHERKLQLQTPSREVYLKGPGMIFKGNPEKYLTEIQFFVKRDQ